MLCQVDGNGVDGRLGLLDGRDDATETGAGHVLFSHSRASTAFSYEEQEEVRSSDQTDLVRVTEIHEAILAPSVPKVAKSERNPLESKRFTEFFPRKSQPTTPGHVSQTDPLPA